MRVFLSIIGIGVLAACATPPRDFQEQAAAGATLYANSCASCHGSSGQGGKGPRLVGLAEGALPLEPPAGAKVRTAQFKTVSDVAAFAVATMPPDRAGSLSADEYWEILAFDLSANGIDLKEKLLTADLAKTLVIPR